jgi:multiple sugar transport system substrate-binding protein
MRTSFLAIVWSASLLFSSAAAQAKNLTVCWAAWDPAAALVELTKDFTAKTGIRVDFELPSWWAFFHLDLVSSLQDRPKCDLVIGASPWLGNSAHEGHYVKLNDFMQKEGIRIDDFLEPAVEVFSTWPKGSKNYYALPAMANPLGWVYRKDWFARPELQAEFKRKHHRALDVPKTWKELKEVAEFFQGRSIDGKTVYGAAIYTERNFEGITMGVTAPLYAWGFQYQDPKTPYRMNGFVNSRNAVEALEFYKSLYACCTPPGHSNAYMTENLDAYRSGQVAMQMNWFAFFPGIARDPDVGGPNSGFFANPSQKVAASPLGGQGISVIAYSDQKDNALQYIKWFSQAEVQKQWWALGGYSSHKAVLLDPHFAKSAPFAGEYLKALRGGRDFWQEPAHRQLLLAMQKRMHNYVVADKDTAQQALDLVVQDWTQVFKEEDIAVPR